MPPHGAERQDPTLCELCPLRALPLFEAPQGDDFAAIREARQGQVEVAARGEIIGASEPPGQMFTLFRGWAFRYRVLAGGARQILDFLLPGDLIGFTGSAPARPGEGVCALTDVVLCRFPASLTDRMIERYPRLTRGLIEQIQLDAERSDRRLTSLGRQTPGQRLALLMLELRERWARRGEAGAETPFPLSYEQMADAVGLSRAQLARSLSDLRERGWAVVSRGRLTIHEPDDLARFCEFDPSLYRTRRTLF